MTDSTRTNPKPITAALPAGLQILAGVKCWTGQEYTPAGEKIYKTPKGINGISTGPNRPQDLGTYEEAAAMCRRFGYTGMAIHAGIEVKAGIVVQTIDLDGVRDPSTGTITAQAVEIVKEMNSYTEISISGTGLHIVYLAQPDGNMKTQKKEGACGAGTRLEIFTAAHFCGITGNVYGEYNTIALRTKESQAIYLWHFDYAEIDHDIVEKEKKRGTATGTPSNRDQIDRLKGNLPDYLQRNGLPIKKHFRCVTPGHADHNPSMIYYRKGQCCHCFGCGANYDIFDMAGALEHLPTFPEQLQHIANLYGEEVEPYQPEPETAQEIPPTINIYDYLTGGQYAADLKQFQQGAEIKTGFQSLDQKIGGGLYAGLYILGAVPSLGKTTYALQLADQIAEQHKHVLFFSLEMSRLDLVTKSITRTAREMNPGDQRELKTSLQLRKGYTSAEMEQALQRYTETTARYISVIEGNFSTTADTIRATAEQFIKDHNEQPVIIIDYLQILKPLNGTRASDARIITDQNTTALKRMSRDLATPVIVISSFNRMNYKQTVDYESFKETSGIEYTADVLLGLEYKIISTLDGKNPNADREAVNQAKEAPEREIILKCLKNRFGQSHFEIPMTYIPRFDYFKEDIPNRRYQFTGVKVI